MVDSLNGTLNPEQPDTWHKLVPRAHGRREVRFTRPRFVDGTPLDWQAMAYELLDVLYRNFARNAERYLYYEGENPLKDFGISTPPELLSVETVVGWPNKAVMALALRSRFDGFTAPDEGAQALLDRVGATSRLDVKYRQAVESQGVYGCTFGVVGLQADGRARIDLFDAEHASAVWDDAKGRIAYGLTAEYDGPELAAFTIYTDTENVVFWNIGEDVFTWQAEPHKMGRCLMEAFAYRPTYRKPFGQSRITRAVMSITDSAVRCALGGDVSFQFAVAPQKYLLGADKSALGGKSKWEAYIGNIFGVGYNGDVDKMPVFGQLPQASMGQYVDYMRALAARFSGETNVPISQLGIIHDNPSSAEAIYAANEPLIIECEDLNSGNRWTLKALASMAMAAELGVPLDELPESFRDFTANFANPATPSVVSMADAAVKIAGAVPGFAGTESFWKMLGFPEDARAEVEAELVKANAQNLLSAMFGSE